MLIITKYSVGKYMVDNQNIKIYNLCSYNEDHERLDILPVGKFKYDEKQFDVDYAKALIDNDSVFVQFFKPLYDIYEGNHAVLLIDENDRYEDIITSLCKFISTRYSIMPAIINTIKDLEDLDLDDNNNTISGVYNLDIDKERYIRLIHEHVIENVQ